MTLLTLPNELLDHVCSFLPPEDLGRLSRTCRRFRELMQSDFIWSCSIRSVFPFLSHKDANMQTYLNERTFRSNIRNEIYSHQSILLPCDTYFDKIVPLSDNLIALYRGKACKIFSIASNRYSFTINDIHSLNGLNLIYQNLHNLLLHDLTSSETKTFTDNLTTKVNFITSKGDRVAISDASITQVFDINSNERLMSFPYPTQAKNLIFNEQGTLLLICHENESFIWNGTEILQTIPLNYSKMKFFNHHLFCVNGSIVDGHIVDYYQFQEGQLVLISSFIKKKLFGFYNNCALLKDEFKYPVFLETMNLNNQNSTKAPLNFIVDSIHSVSISENFLIFSSSSPNLYDLSLHTVNSDQFHSKSTTPGVIFNKKFHLFNWDFHQSSLEIYDFKISKTAQISATIDLLTKVKGELNLLVGEFPHFIDDEPEAESMDEYFNKRNSIYLDSKLKDRCLRLDKILDPLTKLPSKWAFSAFTFSVTRSIRNIDKLIQDIQIGVCSLPTKTS